MQGGCGPLKQADAASRRSRRATPGGFQARPNFGACPSPPPPTPPPPVEHPSRRAPPRPAFDLPDQHGRIHRLSDAKKPVVLFFYPKDDTPGCTKEACGFQAAEARLEAAGALVYGVSPQNVASKKKFADKHGLAFPLLADEGAAACAAYGVWQEKSMYGKRYAGRRPHHLPDRRRRRGRPPLGQGQGRRPRRKGARGAGLNPPQAASAASFASSLVRGSLRAGGHAGWGSPVRPGPLSGAFCASRCTAG